MGHYRPRILDTVVADALAALGAVVIEGPKACGKTETARQYAASEVLLDVDVEAAQVAAVDPRLILDGPAPRLIDEWQREPRVWDAVRRAIDERRTPGQFILTGSASPADDTPRHSGAGRMAVVRMRPMTLFEQGFSSGAVSVGDLLDGREPAPGQSDVGLAEYAERLVVGGWPGLLGASVPDAVRFIHGYLDTITDYDVLTVSGTRRDPRLVRRFLHAYAQLTSHPCKLSTILQRARGEDGDEDAGGPSRWAAEPYLDALRRLMVIDEIEAWSPELRSRSRLIGTPKRHLVDPSLAAALLDCDVNRLLGDLKTLGYLFESLAARDLRVYAGANHASVFHYRERTGALEVDLIVERTDGAWVGLEIKLGGALIDGAAAALLRLATHRTRRPPAAVIVVTAAPYTYRREDGVWVVPLASFGP